MASVVDERRRNPKWGQVVERWNALRPWERQQRVAECRAKGHDWIEATGMDANICVRCCKWGRR